MKKHAEVVIGANFGDEGKGLITDYITSHADNPIVVRFNGGAQAGHTVTTPDGKRHVFGHLGSGSFLGAPTFLSRFFVVNPLLYFKERAVLAGKCAIPAVIADGQAPVTTPYDMLINQMIEEFRGSARHGSCGVGFGETIERNLRPEFATTVEDLRDSATLRRRLEAIRDNWVPERLEKLGITSLSAKHTDLFASESLLSHFIATTEDFANEVAFAGNGCLKSHGAVIFEGAQGLLLDQDRGTFPHVTRSNTGLKNVLALAEDAGIEALTVTYGTRAYMTRHGAGPLDHEVPEKPYAGIVDATNIPNDYQGTLRFAHLDLDSLADRITTDLSDRHLTPAIRVAPQLSVSCLDQVGSTVEIITGKSRKMVRTSSLPSLAAGRIGTETVLASYGPSRETLLREYLDMAA